MSVKSVALFASKGAEAERIAEFCRRNFETVEVRHGDWKEPFPNELNDWKGDLVVSYCSRWILPSNVLEAATFAAINFHPGPPEYPGVGGLNWALYESRSSFGVTCHHMAPRVDSGDIIETRRFPVFETDNAESLFHRTHLQLELQAYEILGALRRGADLPKSTDEWSSVRKNRRELNELAEVTPEMSEVEIGRRVRATTFKHWRPTMKHNGFTFEVKV